MRPCVAATCARSAGDRPDATEHVHAPRGEPDHQVERPSFREVGRSHRLHARYAACEHRVSGAHAFHA